LLGAVDAGLPSSFGTEAFGSSRELLTQEVAMIANSTEATCLRMLASQLP